MMNKNLKSMVKRIFAGVMTMSLVLGFTAVNAYAAPMFSEAEVREAVTERRQKALNVELGKVFKEGDATKIYFMNEGGKKQSLDAPTTRETLGTDICEQGCKNILSSYTFVDGYYEYADECLDCMLAQGCGIEAADAQHDPNFQKLFAVVNGNAAPKKEEVKKEEPKQNPHVQAIKEKRQWLINNGINDRENNKYFQVFVNNELSNVKLDVNDKIDVDNSGLCKGEHRMVTYFQNHGQLEFVGQCLDCNEQRITMAEEVLPGMNVVGTKVAKAEEKVVEVKTIVKGLTEEEQQEITRNYKLADMKAAIDSLE